jgi:hypothetical protein
VQLSWSASSSLSPSSKLRAAAKLGNDEEDIANFDKHIKKIESGLSSVKFVKIDQVRFGLVRQDTKIMCIVLVLPYYNKCRNGSHSDHILTIQLFMKTTSAC